VLCSCFLASIQKSLKKGSGKRSLNDME